MKIGIDISQIVYGTGVSNYTKELVRALLEIDHENQYILFGTSLRKLRKLNEFKDELSRHKNVEFKFLLIPPTILEILWNKLHLFSLEKFIGEVDVFHSSDWTQPPIRSKKTKKVTTVHDMVVYLFESSTHPKIIKNQKRRLNTVKREVDTIIADSQSTKQDLVKFLEVEPEKVKVVYLAASDSFKPIDSVRQKEVLAKYKIKKPYILSVATQEPRKNIQKLIDVFAKLVEEHPELSLVLTGKYGWGTGYKFVPNVIWTEYVPEEDLPFLYSGCRVFVYPSLYEGFGLPVLEAMACGTPVVTSNNSSLTEIAKGTAILIDPRSEGQLKKAIELVLSLDMENYQKMAKASINRAGEYSWGKTARQTLAIYKELYDQIPEDKPDDENIVQKLQGEVDNTEAEIQEPDQKSTKKES